MLYIKYNKRQTRFQGTSYFCTCKICTGEFDIGDGCATTTLFKGSIPKTWEYVLCAKLESDVLHALPCLMGTCNKCSTKKLQCCCVLVKNSKSVKIHIF